MIRVRFPDNLTLEVSFHPTETIQSLTDLLKNVIAHPELPFYLCEYNIRYRMFFFLSSHSREFRLILNSYACTSDTTPPKRQINDMSQDFFTAGFVPGAIVYFAYDVPKGKYFCLSRYQSIYEPLLLYFDSLEFFQVAMKLHLQAPSFKRMSCLCKVSSSLLNRRSLPLSPHRNRLYRAPLSFRRKSPLTRRRSSQSG